jgi:exocyst complex component 3
MATVDLAEQAEEARQDGLMEVIKLLQSPEDLNRLHELRTDFSNKHKANKAGVSGVMQSQVEAIRMGVNLLDKAHRCIMRIGCNLEKINE